MKNEVPTLEETIRICLETPELVKEYERLVGEKLVPTTPIHIMIDEATGYDKKKAHDFFDFVRDYIWMPTVMEIFREKVRLSQKGEE